MTGYVRLLGAPLVEVGSTTYDFPPVKASALLLYLAYRGGWVSRDHLLYTFYPDTAETPARSNLRQLLTSIRRLPYGAGIESETARLRWGIATDMDAFRQAMREANWPEAVRLYRSELLHGFQVHNVPEFDNWLMAERQELHRAWREATFALAAELQASARPLQAEAALSHLLEADPFDEEVLRHYLEALQQGGQRGKALAAFEAFRQTLQRELDSEPDTLTLHLAEQLRSGEPVRLQEGGIALERRVTSAPPVAAKPPHNLPVQMTQFVGRTVEKARVSELLRDPACRLLTITGAGGIGKTRLAIEGARDVLDAFSDGVYFVSLAPVPSAEFAASAIAASLRFTFYGATSPENQLLGYARDKELLLVLDNFEHLLPAAQLVADLLSTSPNLKILVTSRRSLHLYGEHEYSVPPLTVPEMNSGSPLEPAALENYEAVRLFVERAQAVKDSFVLTPDNVSAVAQICHRLDGLPLAIELAAAHSKLFSPEALLTRLEWRLELLSSGPRDRPDRQRTLRGDLAWSHDLLTESEQVLFRRLGVFVGSLSLEAAIAVCGDKNLEILEELGSLVDQSLLQVTASPRKESRFSMLETIREFALELLEASSDAATIRLGYATYYLAVAEEAEVQLKGQQQGLWLARLDEEHNNLRSVLGWALEHSEAELGLRLAGALWRFWWMHGHLSEGQAWLVRVLSQPEAERRTAARAQALNGAGVLAGYQGDYRSAHDLHQESLAIRQELGDKRGTAASLDNLGVLACDQGDYASARLRHEESLVLWRELDDKAGSAISLNNLGNVARNEGDYTSARSFYQASLVIKQALGDKKGIANALSNLGIVARDLGELAEARPLFEESLVLKREAKDKWGIAAALIGLGEVVHDQGDNVSALAFFSESLVLLRDLGDKRGVIAALECLASVMAAQGLLERAVRLWGAVAAARERANVPLPPSEQVRFERDLSSARRHMDEVTFTAVWAQGRVMTLEQAGTEALSS